MPPTDDDVRRQLDRLLSSAVFANAGRMSRFLRFVVDRTLAGESDRLKEYVIGVEVFDRDADYDPRVDSIVRVEAARLRSKLAEYYAGEGRNDALVLNLPKGGYAPVVQLAGRLAAANGAPAASGPVSPAAAPAHGYARRAARYAWLLGAILGAGTVAAAIIAWGSFPSPSRTLRIAVLPFTPAVADRDGTLARRLTEGVTAELVRDGRFSVVASSAARAEYSAARRPRDIGAALDADILIQARVDVEGENLRVETYAVSGDREEKLWVEGFAGVAGEREALEREIAAAVAHALSASPPSREGS